MRTQRTNKTSLKNTTAFNAKMKTMNDETYALRRKVIDCLYEIKNRGYKMPRVEVRIVTETKGATAYAYTGQNIIHVDEKWINQDIMIRTLHEVGHAVFGLGRIDGCLMMDCGDWTRYKVNPEKIWDIFDKYYKEFK